VVIDYIYYHGLTERVLNFQVLHFVPQEERRGRQDKQSATPNLLNISTVILYVPFCYRNWTSGSFVALSLALMNGSGESNVPGALLISDTFWTLCSWVIHWSHTFSNCS
jgi:hypothetical protein